ncbi:hypothetical protein [Streptobacillus canis]|uniref:hypothetical protein n=1 Tax=Streptobacillus canis TaxID=2678686 RepID=UPI0012E2FC16|nr:hypothetical protein [Streptobacillus canis]
MPETQKQISSNQKGLLGSNRVDITFKTNENYDDSKLKIRVNTVDNRNVKITTREKN